MVVVVLPPVLPLFTWPGGPEVVVVVVVPFGLLHGLVLPPCVQVVSVMVAGLPYTIGAHAKARTAASVMSLDDFIVVLICTFDNCN